MKFTLTADAPVKVPDVDAICLKKVKRVAISEEEQNKIKDTFGKGQLMQEENNENEQAGTYTVDGLTYQYSYVKSEQESDVEELGFQIAKFIFDDCGDMTLHRVRKRKEERFQNYIKAGSGKVSERQRRRFQVLCPKLGRYLKVFKITYRRKHYFGKDDFILNGRYRWEPG